jgi:hypothetical protein
MVAATRSNSVTKAELCSAGQVSWRHCAVSRAWKHAATKSHRYEEVKWLETAFARTDPIANHLLAVQKVAGNGLRFVRFC